MARSRRNVTAAPPTYEPTDSETKARDKVLDCIAEGMRWHTDFARRVERRYDAYRGMQPENAPKTWRSQMHPPYLINIVEGMLSSMEEAQPSWRAKARAYPGITLDEAMMAKQRAEVASYMLNDQMRIDEFARKQRPFMQQDLIAGYTVGKVYWLREERERQYLDEQPEMIYDDAGGTIDIAMKLGEYSEPIVFRDSPTFEPRDVRDFLFPESATSIEKAPWLLDRTFVTYETLERMEALGIYKNVKFVKETRMDESQRGPDVVGEREQRLRGADRTRGLVEVIELWTDTTVCTLANRTVVLREAPNPFWHGRKPFVVCSAIPDAFQIPGISVIEGLAQMQEMVWSLQNSRLDATRMMANLITLIRGDVDNPDDYEWSPGAQWIVDDPSQVSVLQIDPTLATLTMQAEALLKGDIQNVMGGLPYTGGSESQTQQQTTATGISIVTNIAQSIIQGRKTQYTRMFGSLGGFFLSLSQQYLREERLIEIVGPENSSSWAEIGPGSIKGVFDVDVQISGDSMMRQERRAEAQALVQMAMQSAPVMAQAGQPLNLKAFWDKLLESYDVAEKEAFFATPRQSPLQPGLPPGADPNAPPGGTSPDAESLLQQMMGGGGDGATNGALAAGPTSPSSDVSLSPAAAQQRSLARSGAGRSV